MGDAQSVTILSWNVRGIGRRRVDEVVNRLNKDFAFDVVACQEFTHSKRRENFITGEGHCVLVNSPIAGRRSSCLIVHARYSLDIDASCVCIGNSCAVAISSSGYNLWVVCSHLDSGHFIQDGKYQSDLADLHDIIHQCPPQHRTILCVDAQDSLGPLDEINSSVLGDLAEEGRSSKGELFLELLSRHKLKVWNTVLGEESDGTFTCNFDLKREPKQIDFIASGLPHHNIKSCRIYDSDINLSDHRLLALQLHPLVGRTRFQTYEKMPPKPLGWRWQDHHFNQMIRNSLHLPNPADHDFIPFQSYNVFTDGSARCQGRGRKVVGAGWGFVAYDSLQSTGDPCRSFLRWSGLQSMPRELMRAHGPVVTKEASPFYLGCDRKSNNTAELSAAIEALLFIISNMQTGVWVVSSGVSLFTDSKYVLGLATFKFAPKENLLMGRLLQHLVRFASKLFTVQFIWVKGHSSCIANQIADKLAKDGADFLQRASWWRRPFVLWDWGMEDFQLYLQRSHLGSNEVASGSSIDLLCHAIPTYTAEPIIISESAAADTLHSAFSDLPSMSTFTSIVSKCAYRLTGLYFIIIVIILGLPCAIPPFPIMSISKFSYLPLDTSNPPPRVSSPI